MSLQSKSDGDQSPIPNPIAFSDDDDDVDVEDNVAFLAKVNQITQSVAGSDNLAMSQASAFPQHINTTKEDDDEDFKDTIDDLLKEQNELELEFNSNFPLKSAAKKKPIKPKRQTWQNPASTPLPLPQNFLTTTSTVLDDFCLDKQSQSCWDRIQSSLLKNCKGIQLSLTAEGKPIEASMLTVVQSLITSLNDLQAQQRGNTLQTQLLLKQKSQEQQSQSSKQSEVALQLQAQLDDLKQINLKDTRSSDLKLKQGDTKLKEFRIKLQHSEALVGQKDKDLSEWRKKWDRRDLVDEKYTVKNKQIFESHFGQKVQPAKDDRVLGFMRMYEVQMDKLKKELALSQQARDETNDYGGNKALANEEVVAQNEELRDMLQQNSEDFKDLLKQLEQLRGDVERKQTTISDLEREIAMRPSLGEANQMKIEMKHLRNNITQLEASVTNTVAPFQQPPYSTVVSPGISDSRLVLSEICEILQIPSDDNVALLDTVRKISKVVMAVPRMEGFISNISRQMIMIEDNQLHQIPLEQIIPRLQIWKQIVETTQSSLEPLLNFKHQIASLILGPQNASMTVPEQLLFEHVLRLKQDNYEMSQSQQSANENAKMLSYIKNLFACVDNKDLIQKVNDFFTHVTELNTFVKICRSLLQLDVSVSLQLVLDTVRNVLIQHSGKNDE